MAPKNKYLTIIVLFILFVPEFCFGGSKVQSHDFSICRVTYNSIMLKNKKLYFSKYLPAMPDKEKRNFKNRMINDLKCAANTTWSDFKYVYSSPKRINAKSLIWIGEILAVGGTLLKYDQEIYDAIKRNQNHKYYEPIRKTGEFFEPLGFMGFTNKFIFGSLVIGYIADYKPAINISFDLLEHFLIASVAKNALMISAGRKGPMIEKGARRFKFNNGRSMPSGHSLAIMQMASVFAHHIDNWPFKIFAYGAAGTVLLQRITSDHHWPSDVFAGATLGWTISHGIYKGRKQSKLKINPTTWDGGKGFGLFARYSF